MSGDFFVGIADDFEGGGDFVNATVEAGGVEFLVGPEGEVEDVGREIDLLAFFKGQRVHERIWEMGAALFST